MAKKLILDKQVKKALTDARAMIETVITADANEAETGRRIERLFDSLMGYDVFKHITREHAVHGIGDADYCDFAIHIDEEKKIPTILVEIKKATRELSPKHLKQAASYAINVGCEWAILTNGKVWQLYHISFGQPPQTILLHYWDLIEDDLGTLADKFALVGYKNVKRDGLKQVWQKSNVLTPENVIRLLLSETSISMIKRGIKKSTDVNVTPEEVVSAIRHLLNESALSEMDKIRIYLPGKKTRAPARQKVSEVITGSTLNTVPNQTQDNG
mgnify:CR=1 FL=1